MLSRIAMFFKGMSDYLKSDLCLFKYFKDAFVISNSNIILATPLILFIIMAGTYLMVVPANKFFSIAFVLVLFFAMSAVFFSGWFYSVKLAVDNALDSKKDVEGNDDTFYLLKQFPAGVGTNFIDFFLMIIIFFILLTIVIVLTYKTGFIFIGDIGITRPELFFALSSPDEMYKLISSLPADKLMKLSYWNMYFFFTTTIYSFLVMFWAPDIIYSKNSVLKSFINSIIKLFKTFFKSLTVFSFIMLLYFIITILSALITTGFLNFILMVIYFYFIVYSAVLIFLFYRKEFGENE